MSSESSLKADKVLSILDLNRMKAEQDKITCLTAYDASFSALLDQAGIDAILVGDSLGMVIQGQTTTIPVTIQDMAYHTACVARGRKRAMVIADLPFMSYATIESAGKNAARLMRQGAQMVKLEGGCATRLDVVQFLSEQGIPVCGHLGLLPQSINQLGAYHTRGKNQQDANELIRQAEALEAAGCRLLVVECIPAALAGRITAALSIPTIGIGAGSACDGQVLVLYDMLNINCGKSPKFCKNFLKDGQDVSQAIQQFINEVKQGDFPDEEHSY